MFESVYDPLSCVAGLSYVIFTWHVKSDLSQCFFVANADIIKEVTDVNVIAVNIETDINANMANLDSAFNLILLTRWDYRIWKVCKILE